MEVRRLEQGFREGVLEHGDVLGVGAGGAELVNLDRLPVAVDLHGHPRALLVVRAGLQLCPVRLGAELGLEAGAAADDAVALHRRRTRRAAQPAAGDRAASLDGAGILKVGALIRVGLDHAHAGGALADAGRARDPGPLSLIRECGVGVRENVGGDSRSEGKVRVHGELVVGLDAGDHPVLNRGGLVQHEPVANLELLGELARVRVVDGGCRVRLSAHDGELLARLRVGQDHLFGARAVPELASAARGAERERDVVRDVHLVVLNLHVRVVVHAYNFQRVLGGHHDDNLERVLAHLVAVLVEGGVAAELLGEAGVLADDHAVGRGLARRRGRRGAQELNLANAADHVGIRAEGVTLGVVALLGEAVAAGGVRIVTAPACF